MHSERTAALLGITLGIAFSVCFVTGILSHLIQRPPSWFTWPARPAGLYRINQGVHVATGIAAIPLLLAKLWAVYPKLFRWPPVRGVADALERLSLLPLVGGALFLLVSGWQNITLWYPWPFFFPPAHRGAAWVTMGALVVHIGAKITITRRALARPVLSATAEAPATASAGLSRRQYLTLAGLASAGLTVLTVGQTVRPLRRLALLAPRRPDVGPQGVPVNRAAAEAGVVDRARDPAYRLVVEGAGGAPLELDLAQLQALPQREASLPISCVEGWSAGARWRGVSVPELLRRAGVAEGRDVEVEVVSLEEAGLYSRSMLNTKHSGDPDTLLALELNGEPLDIDHGYPVRLIGPNRPGVLQTKWVTRMVVR